MRFMASQSCFEFSEDFGGGRAIGKLAKPVTFRTDQVKGRAVGHGISIRRVRAVFTLVIDAKAVRRSASLCRIPGQADNGRVKRLVYSSRPSSLSRSGSIEIKSGCTSLDSSPRSSMT